LLMGGSLKVSSALVSDRENKAFHLGHSTAQRLR
jgi:hypothetical protein